MFIIAIYLLEIQAIWLHMDVIENGNEGNSIGNKVFAFHLKRNTPPEAPIKTTQDSNSLAKRLM